MNAKRLLVSLSAALLISGAMALPTTASAHERGHGADHRQTEQRPRQKQKKPQLQRKQRQVQRHHKHDRRARRHHNRGNHRYCNHRRQGPPQRTGHRPPPFRPLLGPGRHGGIGLIINLSDL